MRWPATRTRNANDAEAAIDAIFAFTTKVLEIVAPHVPIVKFQSAYFEKYLWEGVETYYSLDAGSGRNGPAGDRGRQTRRHRLHQRGLRGGTPRDPAFDEMDEVVSTRRDHHQPVSADWIRSNRSSKTAKDFGKGLFVLVRTSNPGSVQLQDAKLEDGRTYSEMLADNLRPIASAEGLVGDSGFSSIGAVVGATQTHTMQSLRQRLPQSIFLLPGYGTQGATAEMTKAAFTDGKGAIVSASRSILYAHRETKNAGKSWEDAVRDSVRAMKQDLAGVL